MNNPIEIIHKEYFIEEAFDRLSHEILKRKLDVLSISPPQQKCLI